MAPKSEEDFRTFSRIRSKRQSVSRLCCMLAIGVFGGLSISGCSPNSEVVATQNYSKIQEQASGLFPKIAKDFYDSCMRSASFVMLNAPPKALDMDRKVREKVCETKGRSASKAVNDVNKLILEYLINLSSLAKGESIDYKTQIDSISKSLQKLPSLSDDESKKAVEAGSGIASLLFKFVATGYQRDQLRQAVLASDQNLQILVSGLSKAVKEEYMGHLLPNELKAVDSYFTEPLSHSLAPLRTSATDRYIVFKLNSSWLESKSNIRDKDALASSYLELLQKVSCDHSRLKDIFLGGGKKTAEQGNIYCPTKNLSFTTQSNGKVSEKSSRLSNVNMISSIIEYERRIDQLSKNAEKAYKVP